MIDILDVRQEDEFDCGWATVEAVCQYFKVYIHRNRMLKLLGTNGINGTDPRIIEAFLRNEGFNVLSGNMTIEDLKSFTKNNRPVIAMVTFNDIGHYVVVKGVKRKRVYYQDPTSGPKSMKIEDFMSSFVDFDRYGVTYRNFGLVIWK